MRAVRRVKVRAMVLGSGVMVVYEWRECVGDCSVGGLDEIV